MRKAVLVAAALALSIGATAAQARDCDPQDQSVQKSSGETIAKLAAPLGQFNKALQRTLALFEIRNSVSVVVVDCPYTGEDVVTRNIFSAPYFGMVYGIYVDASYLKYTPADELWRKAVLEACRIQQGGVEALDPGDRRYAQLRAQHCMAELFGDTELLKWLDRVMPTPQQRNAEIERQNRKDLLDLQRYLTNPQQ